MPSRTIRKKQLFRKMGREMGITTKRPLEVSTAPWIQERFHPHSQKGPRQGYPLYQIMHEFSKLPEETVGNFVDIPKLVRDLKQLPTIGRFLQRYPQLERSFEASVWNAVRERGIKGSKFWETAPKSYIDTIAAGAGGKPNAMNDHVGSIAKQFFEPTPSPRTILDIGTFAGGTIGATVKALSPEQRRMLRIVLVDVNESVIRKYAVPMLVEQGVPRQNIVVLPTSFYSAAVAFRQMRRPLHEKGKQRFEERFRALAGKVDLITSGAATLNFANDLSPLLRSVRKLLKPGGLFVDWEWGSAEGKTPTVNVPQLKKNVITHVNGEPITEFDAYVSFLNFWMGPKYFEYPESVQEKLWTDINQSAKFNFFDWCEQNVEWIEAQRKKSGGAVLADPAGFRNRAYRDGFVMVSAARRYGFRTGGPEYPLGKPGVKDTGNLNWLVRIQKK